MEGWPSCTGNGCSARISQPRDLATGILPEFIPAKWWQALLHNQTAWLLKAALIYHRSTLSMRRVIIDVPYYLRT